MIQELKPEILSRAGNLHTD